MNNMIFTLGVGGMLVMLSEPEKLDKNNLIASAITIIYFYYGSKVVHFRCKKMYSIILNNKMMVEEKEVFSKCFFILCWSFQKTSSMALTDTLTMSPPGKKPAGQCGPETQKVQISVENKKGMKEIQTQSLSLLKYLKTRQKTLEGQREPHKQDIVIEYPRANSRSLEELKEISKEEDSSDSMHEFSIKSLEIERKGRPLFLHVFIDTTDIIKLEEVKNRIKMQRVMFASSSHEFRTPLNAIMNSFNFIGMSFGHSESFIENHISLQELHGANIIEHIDGIKRFLRTGNISSKLLLVLVEDILNLSRIDNGTFTLTHEDLTSQNFCKRFNLSLSFSEPTRIFTYILTAIEAFTGAKCTQTETGSDRYCLIWYLILSSSLLKDQSQ
ncbi:unnamed protein product [Moneuplotes crassus]|uniref:Signal transduction histidine kinase dimerisation/phosphoacceptor domain-containing protein n=1 Tax=Euplotes crassus TaxID=5936 RepID=A0AAD1X608_EUPCR|nr:unnamed protein product [Moneuplotes crassus]